MKLAKVLIWIGRTLGILHFVLIAGIISNTPPSEWSILIIMGSVLLVAIYSVFLFIAWRREFIGGILYLGFITIIALLITINPHMDLRWEYTRLLLPSFLTAVMFLSSGLLKQQVAHPG